MFRANTVFNEKVNILFRYCDLLILPAPPLFLSCQRRLELKMMLKDLKLGATGADCLLMCWSEDELAEGQ